MKKVFLVGLAVLLGSNVAFADRPLVSEEPYLNVGKGEVKVDAGATFTRAGNAEVSSLGEVQVKTGLSDRSEVFVRSNYVNIRGVSNGTTPTVVGAKYVVAPNVAVVATLGTPLGSAVYETNYVPSVILAVGRNIRPGTDLIANVGYTRSDNGATRSNTATGSLALTQDSSVGKLFAEVYGSADKSNAETFVGAVGVSRKVSDSLTLDARVGRSFRDVGEPNYFVGVGFSLIR